MATEIESWRQAVAHVAGAVADPPTRRPADPPTRRPADPPTRRPADPPTRWDGRRVLIIGHVATRWALDHVLGGVPLEKLIAADFNRRQGWKYRTPRRVATASRPDRSGPVRRSVDIGPFSPPGGRVLTKVND